MRVCWSNHCATQLIPNSFVLNCASISFKFSFCGTFYNKLVSCTFVWLRSRRPWPINKKVKSSAIFFIFIFYFRWKRKSFLPEIFFFSFCQKKFVFVQTLVWNLIYDVARHTSSYSSKVPSLTSLTFLSLSLSLSLSHLSLPLSLSLTFLSFCWSLWGAKPWRTKGWKELVLRLEISM